MRRFLTVFIMAAAVLYCVLSVLKFTPHTHSQTIIHPQLQPQTSLLHDIPNSVMELYVREILFDLLTRSQLEILNRISSLAEKNIDPELSKRLHRYRIILKKASDYCDILPDNAYLDEVPLPSYGVVFYDTRQMLPRILELRKDITKNICTILVPVEGQVAIEQEGEIHNFFVFYSRNILAIACKPIKADSTPKFSNEILRQLSELFTPGEQFARLHGYLENFNNMPFMMTNNFYTTLYFKYLAVAYEARQTYLVMREFIWARKDMQQRFEPELRYLGDALFLMRNMSLSE